MQDRYLQLTAIATQQHGAFHRGQAVTLGISRAALLRRTRNGGLQNPYPGVYVVNGSPATWERAVSIAVMSCAPGGVASHATACHLFGLAKRPRTIEITVPTKGMPIRDFVIHRSTDLTEVDVVTVSGIRCTSPARSLVDAGIPWGEGLASRCLSEAVRRGLTTEQEVAKVLHRIARRGRNGVGPMRGVLMERLGWNEITEGMMEDEFLRIMKAAGVDLPESQVTIHRRGGKLIARVDFVYHRFKLVIELDGEKYHSDRESFRKDRRKQNALVLEGYRVLRFTYFDVFAAPEYVVAQVVAAISARRTANLS